METEDIFSLIGAFALPIAVFALTLIFLIPEYQFNDSQFLVNDTNISINSSWIISELNNSNLSININQTINATVNTTQFDSNNPISIKMSWLQSMIEYFAPAPDLSNYYNKSTSDNRFCFANGTNTNGEKCSTNSTYPIIYNMPKSNEVYIGDRNFVLNITVPSNVYYIELSNSHLICERDSHGFVGNYCIFDSINFDELGDNEFNTASIQFYDILGNPLYLDKTLTYYFYPDIQSLADATEEHNVKSTWLEDIKDWILDIARTLFYEKDSNINATGYNISADYFIGNGSQLTGLSEQPFAQQGRLSLPQLEGSAGLIEEVPGWAFSGQTSTIQAVSAWLVPIYVSRNVSYRGFRYYISSTTGKTADSYRVGIYDVDYSTGLPKNLIWDSSKQTFATTTGVKQVLGLNIALTEGWYYIVGTKNGNINLYGSSPAQQRPPLGGFGDPTTKQTLTSTTADWTNGFPNPWVNTGFSHLNGNGYEAAFFKLYRNSEA